MEQLWHNLQEDQRKQVKDQLLANLICTDANVRRGTASVSLLLTLSAWPPLLL